MRMERPRRVPITRFTRKQIQDAIKEYTALLDGGASERRIQKFLASHIFFWNGLIRLSSIFPLYQKIRLGDRYEIDFVYCEPGSLGTEWFFIEIEEPTTKLLNKLGDPSAKLNHAIGQVRAWREWIAKHRDSADELMPGIDHPLGYVFMGRRKEVDEVPKARERLRALGKELAPLVRIHTLDHFIHMAETSLSHPFTTVPPYALSHRQLRDGMSREAVTFIRSPMGRSLEFLRQRKWDWGYEFEEPRNRSAATRAIIVKPSTGRPRSGKHARTRPGK